ncbi:hypothetical protein A2U01_0106821, partial [Trifolium medium]|nr:hypothetical protein [Trifolium medium]
EFRPPPSEDRARLASLVEQ